MTDVPEEQVWYPEVINQEVQRSLEELQTRGVLEWLYLAGGTGLALQCGHRRSVDLDFFSAAMFDEELLIQKLGELGEFSVISRAVSTLHAGIGDVKVSFLGYPYPVLFPSLSFSGVAVADARDIACMKITAIASRGTRRDFIDLYSVSKKYGLLLLLESFKKKYARVNYSGIHILKSLTYFQEAEEDPMPDMLAELSWDEVKDFFRRQVPTFL